MIIAITLAGIYILFVKELFIFYSRHISNNYKILEIHFLHISNYSYFIIAGKIVFGKY